MPERNETKPNDSATEQKWAAYNQKMAALFTQRNAHPMVSPERDAVVERIMALWVVLVQINAWGAARSMEW